MCIVYWTSVCAAEVKQTNACDETRRTEATRLEAITITGLVNCKLAGASAAIGKSATLAAKTRRAFCRAISMSRVHRPCPSPAAIQAS